MAHRLARRRDPIGDPQLGADSRFDFLPDHRIGGVAGSEGFGGRSDVGERCVDPVDGDRADPVQVEGPQRCDHVVGGLTRDVEGDLVAVGLACRAGQDGDVHDGRIGDKQVHHDGALVWWCDDPDAQHGTSLPCGGAGHASSERQLRTLTKICHASADLATRLRAM